MKFLTILTFIFSMSYFVYAMEWQDNVNVQSKDLKSVDWFDALDQEEKEEVLELLSHAMKNEGMLDDDIIRDMFQKFKVSPEMTEELFNLYYLEQVPKCAQCQFHFPMVMKHECDNWLCVLCVNEIYQNPKKKTLCRICMKNLEKFYPIICPILRNMKPSLEKDEHILPLLFRNPNVEVISQWVNALEIDLNKPIWNGFYPIHFPTSKTVLDYLISKGAYIDEQTPLGLTSLHLSCDKGDLEIMKFLVSQKASVGLFSLDAYTPLHLCCKRGNLEGVKFLVERGANIFEAPELTGITPFYLACRSGNLKLVEFLIDLGADVKKAKNDGVTPFYISARKDFMSIVRCLEINGAPIDEPRYDGITPLHTCVEYDLYEMVQFLLQKKADVNHARNDGATPLCIALMTHHKKIARLLIRSNASIDVAHEFLKRNGYDDFVEHLNALSFENHFD